jgi:hypothetical protein
MLLTPIGRPGRSCKPTAMRSVASRPSGGTSMPRYEPGFQVRRGSTGGDALSKGVGTGTRWHAVLVTVVLGN